MEVPFQGSNLNANQRAFNTSMSKSRITVEWIFKEIKMYLPVLDNKRKNEIMGVASWPSLYKHYGSLQLA